MSNRRCPVCSHSEVAVINSWIMADIRPRAAARKINLSRKQLARHVERCLAPTFVEASEHAQPTGGGAS